MRSVPGHRPPHPPQRQRWLIAGLADRGGEKFSLLRQARRTAASLWAAPDTWVGAPMDERQCHGDSAVHKSVPFGQLAPPVISPLEAQSPHAPEPRL
jgi:hypothetical protein